MARRKAAARSRAERGGLSGPEAFSRWPLLEGFVLHDGELTLGRTPYSPNTCCAVVCDEGGMIVALVRRPDETLAQLLDRVEAELPTAFEGTFVDELTPEMERRKKPRRRRTR